MTAPTRQQAEHLGTRQLRQAGLATPDLDARLLLEAVTGDTRATLIAHAEKHLTPHETALYQSLIARRVAREPVGRILGWREFWGLRFTLSPATLEPRPDSETLIEAVLAHRPDRTRAYRILDLGTGTGCLLAALLHEYPNAIGVGVDSHADALKTARANLQKLDLLSRTTLQQGDWGNGLSGPFDILISNPPYIPDHTDLEPEVAHHDPAQALFAGPDGLDAYRALLPGLPALLAPHGLAVLEIGIGQHQPVTALASAARLTCLDCRPDLSQIPRALVLSTTSQPPPPR